MSCHDVQLLISGFIEDRLTDQQMEIFLEHIDSCQDCYDELEVYYMITTGLMQLDEVHTGTLDLKKNLKDYIETKRQNLYNRRRASIRKRRLEMLSIICIACILLFTLYIFAVNKGSIHTIEDFKNIACSTIEYYWFGIPDEIGSEIESSMETESMDPYECRMNFERQHPLIPSYFYFPGGNLQEFELEYRNLLEKDG